MLFKFFSVCPALCRVLISSNGQMVTMCPMLDELHPVKEDTLETLAEYEKAISDGSHSSSVQDPDYVAIISAIWDTLS